MRKGLLFFFSLLSLDILTKIFSIRHIPPLLPKLVGYPYGGMAIFKWSCVSFSLNTVYNSGAAWGIFQGYSGALFAVRSLIIMGLIFYLFSLHRKQVKQSPFSPILLPFWLITVGAIGNSLDYLAYGQVVDFLHVCFGNYSFPVFNLADCFITLGVLALLCPPRKTSIPTPRP